MDITAALFSVALAQAQLAQLPPIISPCIAFEDAIWHAIDVRGYTEHHLRMILDTGEEMALLVDADGYFIVIIDHVSGCALVPAQGDGFHYGP